MIKRLTGLLTATAMVVLLVAGCGAGDKSEEVSELIEVTQEPIEEAVKPDDTAVIVDLSDKKIGICMYYFADNFMTLFRNELEKYLISQGFQKKNI